MRSLQISRRRRIIAAAVATLGFAGSAQLAPGINLTLTYDAANSLEPSFDPTGAQLTVLMNHIKAVYEDIFEDSHNVTVTYRWADLAPGVGGLHTLLSQSGGRETSMLVQLNSFNGATEVPWFMDPTPANDSEFAMSQTLWRDLTPTQRTNFYNAGANVPQTFEVGFQGPATASAPASAQNNPDALSVMFQEVGHGLGMSAANTSTQTETGDDDYDFASVNVFGTTLAADVRTPSTNIAHLADNFAVMFGSAGSGQRTRPGHTDLFSMAAVHNYVALDIPRREFYGGSNWNTSGNWSGNTSPGIFDEVFVRASGPNGEIRTANLSANGFADTLHIHEGSNVNTTTFSLLIGTLLDLDGLNTDMFVSAGGTLSAAGASININNEAELNMLGGVISSVGTINNNAEIIGQGTINVSGRLNNSGSVNVSGGTLLLNATGTGSINLDGFSPSLFAPESGQVVVTGTGNHLVVNGSLSDAFNGDMTIGNSNSVTMNSAWTVGGAGTFIGLADGVINLNGGTTSTTAATLFGSTVTVEGDINVGTSNYGLIDAPIIFSTGNGGAQVLVNGTLEFNNAATYQGGSHTGAGRLVWDGNVFITGNTTIDVAELDLDGFVPLATLQINSGVTLTVNSLITDDSSGTVNIQGSMIVNGGNWANDTGTVILNTGTIGGTSSFTNSALLNVLAGTSSITTGSSFTTSSTNTLTGTLRLGGNSTIAGGTWSGTGILSLDDQSTTFTGSTTLNVNFDIDGLINGTGSVNINSGVVVTANNGLTDTTNNTININSGSLVVNSSAWNNSGVVNLNGTNAGVPAAITGQPFTNNSAGRINISGGVNNPGISGEGTGDGRLGGSGGARIAPGSFINSGSITLAANSFGLINGNITMNGSGNVSIGAGAELSLQGPTTYNGGTYSGPGTLTQETGAMVVAANTTIGVATYDWDGGDLGGFSTTTVNSGVTFTINSNVIEDEPNAYDSTITVNSGSLTVNTTAPWPLAGTLNLIDTGAGDSVLSGQPVQLLTGGQINVTNGAQIPAGVQYSSGGINTISSVTVLSGPFSSIGAGVLNKTGVAQLNVNGPQSHAAGSQLNILAGTVVLNTDAGAGGQNLTINHSGSSLSMSVSQRLARLNINAGATATLAGAGNDNVLRTNILNIAGGAAPTATLNLTDENMVVDYTGASPIATIKAQLLSGYNNGNWTGLGIRSSAAAAASPKNTALGYAEASQIYGVGGGTFNGQAVDGTSVLVKYTWYGDTDLNGVVNFDDYARTDNGFNNAGNDWFHGDFNYNSVVNFDDYALIDLAFNTQSGTLRRAMSFLEGNDRSTDDMNVPALQFVLTHFNQFGEGYASSLLNAVPEPASAAMLAGLVSAGLLARRRRACIG